MVVERREVGVVGRPDAREGLTVSVENRERGMNGVPHGRSSGLVQSHPEFVVTVDDRGQGPDLGQVGLPPRLAQGGDHLGDIEVDGDRVGASDAVPIVIEVLPAWPSLEIDRYRLSHVLDSTVASGGCGLENARRALASFGASSVVDAEARPCRLAGDGPPGRSCAASMRCRRIMRTSPSRRGRLESFTKERACRSFDATLDHSGAYPSVWKQQVRGLGRIGYVEGGAAGDSSGSSLSRSASSRSR